MSETFVTTVIDNATGWATITMDRTEVLNAFDATLIAQLTADLETLAKHNGVTAVVLAGAGKSFSAGADLNWMQRMAGYSEHENLTDARALGRMLKTLRDLPKPTVARVHGAAIGGAVGLIAACDIAFASDQALFAVSEVRVGLIPAVISPYVIAAIGERQFHRYALTGERFAAPEAMRIGLVHSVVEPAELDSSVRGVLGELAKGGPSAKAEVKALISSIAGRPIDSNLIDETATRIARVRASAEGREGVDAFLEKRKPAWIKQ